MTKFKSIMVAVDMTEMDNVLFKYTAALGDLIQPEKVYFVHIAKSLDVAEDIPDELIEAYVPLDEELKNDLKNMVDQYCNDTKWKVEYDILEGEPFEKLLHLTKIKNTDLVIVGRKDQHPGTGVVPEKVARKAPCSVLFVTEDVPLPIKKIHVPIDFSEHSKMALEHADELATKLGGATITAQNIFTVPPGYSRIGKTYEEMGAIIKKNKVEAYDKFMKNVSLKNPVEPIFTLDDDGDPAKIINHYIQLHRSDLVIIGSRGRTDPSAFLLGSVAEKLIRYDFSVPVLVMKKKGENMSFLEALLKV